MSSVDFPPSVAWGDTKRLTESLDIPSVLVVVVVGVAGESNGWNDRTFFFDGLVKGNDRNGFDEFAGTRRSGMQDAFEAETGVVKPFLSIIEEQLGGRTPVDGNVIWAWDSLLESRLSSFFWVSAFTMGDWRRRQLLRFTFLVGDCLHRPRPRNSEPGRLIDGEEEWPELAFPRLRILPSRDEELLSVSSSVSWCVDALSDIKVLIVSRELRRIWLGEDRMAT